MTDASDLAELNVLIRAKPEDFGRFEDPNVQRWAARVLVIAERHLAVGDLVNLNARLMDLARGPQPLYQDSRAVVGVLLHKALVRIEDKVGSSASSAPTGSVIAPGALYSAFVEITGVLKSARSELFIVDPYMDETVLSEFCLVAPEEVAIRLLTVRRKVQEKALRVALGRWVGEFAQLRPIQCRIDATNKLHDRLIFVDSVAVWQLSQSIKDFAKRAMATVIPLDGRLLPAKLQFYEALWGEAAEYTTRRLTTESPLILVGSPGACQVTPPWGSWGARFQEKVWPGQCGGKHRGRAPTARRAILGTNISTDPAVLMGGSERRQPLSH